MLIKDPYLGSEIKPRAFSTHQPSHTEVPSGLSKDQYLSQPYKKPQQSLKPAQDVIHTYQRQIRSLSEAYKGQEQMLNKMKNLHFVNNEYNQAMKQRNYELNAKLSNLTYEKSLLAKKYEQDTLKSTYDKDLILRKYEEQNEQIIRLKRSNGQLLEQKARLQSEIDHLMFLMEKDNHQGSLQVKEQLIRMENMERTLRGIIDTKDAEIIQLRHRLKVYEDENKRLNDLNKTLTITRQHQRIENLSNISQIDSNVKFQQNKENIDTTNRKDDIREELNQQKRINEKLMGQINIMKKKLFDEEESYKMKKNPKKVVLIQEKQEQLSDKREQTVEQKIERFSVLRADISSKVYQTYVKSLKEGEKERKNSLLLFIENYKKSLKKEHLQDQIDQYMLLRQEVKTMSKQKSSFLTAKQKNSLQMQIPLRLNSRSHTKQSEYVLSTIQFTKNQRNASGQDQSSPGVQYNNGMLFMFRLLTILYRIRNPIQDKKEQNQGELDKDVQNQLLHSIVKALEVIVKL